MMVMIVLFLRATKKSIKTKRTMSASSAALMPT